MSVQYHPALTKPSLADTSVDACTDRRQCAWEAHQVSRTAGYQDGSQNETLGLAAGVCRVFWRKGQTKAHGYLFANSRANRLKLLVHDGFGVWCATRRLHAGRFVWYTAEAGSAACALQLSTQQFEALTLGLPWQRLGELATIRRC